MTVAAGTALPPAAGTSAGIVMPIGGAEDKIGRMTVLREVVRLAGGSAARIVVISTASSLGDEITHAYLQLFATLGVDRRRRDPPGEPRPVGRPRPGRRASTGRPRSS